MRMVNCALSKDKFKLETMEIKAINLKDPFDLPLTYYPIIKPIGSLKCLRHSQLPTISVNCTLLTDNVHRRPSKLQTFNIAMLMKAYPLIFQNGL